METFFPDDSPLRFWLCNASVAQIACTVTWPPVIAVTGHAPCVRAWAPTSRDEPEFKPVQQLLEVDGERFVAVAVKGDLLVAADASPSGRVSIWDTTTWQRLQTVTADAPVTALDASRTYIAAGTSAGYVRVWRRQSAVDPTFTQYFQPDVQLDSLPIYTVRLGPLRQPGAAGAGAEGGAGTAAGDSVMVVHTRGNGRVSAWRLSDAKIIGTLGRPPPAPGSPAEAEALLSANVVCCVLGRDGTLLTASWVQGRQPLLQWVNPLARSGSEVPGVSQHLAGLTSRPMCCDTDGNAIALGFEDGTVWVWGALHSYQPPPPSSSSAPSAPETSHWRGYHRGAVGAVACLPHRPGGQLASAGADGCVKLWAIGGGQLLAVARLGWQVTCLAVNELALVAGGAEGQVQVLVLVSEEQAAAAAGHSSRPTEQERAEAATAPSSSSAAAAGPAVVRYSYWFDARSPKQAAAGASGGSGAGSSGGAGVCGLADEYPDAFAAFVPPRKQLTAADLQQQQQQQGSCSRNGGGDGDRGAVMNGDGGGGGASASAAEVEAAEGAGEGKASSFNMKAAIKGAQPSAADQAAAAEAEEAAKRAQLRAMGEAPGVARSRGAVQLDSATAALGRKCSNPSCLQREGVAELRAAGRGGGGGGAAGGGAAFKRCGACKSVVYCSAHCQSTHWRDGHKKECAVLAAAWKQQQEEEAAAVAAALADGDRGGEDTDSAAATPSPEAAATVPISDSFLTELD